MIDDGQQMTKQYANAWRFVQSRPLSTSGLYLSLGIVGWLIFLLISGLRNMVDQSSALSVLVAIILGQLAIVTRIWFRVSLIGAEFDLYQRYHLPSTQIAPVSTVEAQPLPTQEESPMSQSFRDLDHEAKDSL